MTLIKSISGIRGTIGGGIGDNLTPIDIVACTMGYAQYINSKESPPKVVVGRDGRISGEQVSQLVIQTLIMMGIDVVDLDLSTTPTVEIAVPLEKAGGGIIITASHNPKQWNALKFLDEKGEFISSAIGKQILDSIEDGTVQFAGIDDLGAYTKADGYISKHIELICNLPYIDKEKIRQQNYFVIVDCINSTGAILLPALLDELGVKYQLINEEINGEFAHNPEPLPKHMTQLSKAVTLQDADLGICVDPDVDRLAFICEDGKAFGEEYTLVACADYMLSKKPGNTVSNLSSTRALADITQKYGQRYEPAAVGEVNVVNKMKATQAVIGGEGNGGVILPDLHYGRDAAVGIALVLNLIAERQCKLSELKSSYPSYNILKEKIQLTPEIDIENLLNFVGENFQQEKLNTIDGLKIDFDKGWVHMRKSNTEPIIRVYAESKDVSTAKQLINNVMEIVNKKI